MRLSPPSLGALAALALSAAPAAAEAPAAPAPASAAPASAPAPHGIERRGIMFGVTGGFAMGTAEGYPNDVNQLGDPQYYSAGGFQVGESFGGHIMGVFAKELSFGVFATQGWSISTSGKWESFGAGGGFRVEVFPFTWITPQLQNLGLVGMFGVGTATLTAREGASPGGAGTQSLVGFGVFHEWAVLPIGHTHLDLGPAIEVHVIPTQPLDRATISFGLRISFYSGGA